MKTKYIIKTIHIKLNMTLVVYHLLSKYLTNQLKKKVG